MSSGSRLGSRFLFPGPALYPADDEGSSGFTTFDLAAGRGTPASPAEWAAAGFPAPDYYYLCQEASGALIDTGNLGAGKNLSSAGSTAFQQAIAGWTRKAVGNQGLGTAANFQNATMDNINATSVAWFALLQFVAPTTGNDRLFWGGASANSLQSVSASAVQRLRTGANAANGALSHVGSVHPHFGVYSLTGSRNTLYSDIEKVNVTFAASAGSTLELVTGTTDVTLVNQCLLLAGWRGTNADFWTDTTVKAALQAQAWPVSGY